MPGGRAAPLLATVIAAALLLAAACASAGEDAEGASGLRIVASTTIIADLVKGVAGEDASVATLLPAGADAHSYSPSPGDARELTRADIVFINGLGLEEPAQRVIEANVSPEATVVALAETLVREGVGTLGDDPHLWLDPSLALRYVDAILATLEARDPERAQQYVQRAEELKEKVRQADASARTAIQVVPPEARKLVTAHAGFRYFAEHYGLELVGFVVASPAQEPSPADLAELTRTIEEQNVPAVFVEPQLDAAGKVLRQAAADAHVDVCVLYSDALDSRAPTYVDLIAFNASELARCLGGEDRG